MATKMTTYHTILTGSYVAECPSCHTVCAYWDDDDLNDEGDLLCWCDEPTTPLTDPELIR